MLKTFPVVAPTPANTAPRSPARAAPVMTATPSLHIPKQGELAHDQNLAIDIYQGEIHPPLVIVEDSQAGDLVDRRIDVVVAITGRHANEKTQPAPDAPDNAAVDTHQSRRNSLQNYPHQPDSGSGA